VDLDDNRSCELVLNQLSSPPDLRLDAEIDVEAKTACNCTQSDAFIEFKAIAIAA